ncbi:MAG: hypothetical protein R2813_12375 [Flavobacteriales bacterium]
MIRLLVFSICLFSFGFIKAQDSTALAEPREFMPDAKDIGVTANVTGLISNFTGNTRTDLRGVSMALIRYNINDRLTFRVGLAPSVMSIHSSSTDSAGKDLIEYDSTAKQSAFSIRPGVEFHFNGTKRLDPYIALDAEFGIIGQFRAGVVTKTTDTTGTALVNRTITEAGGFGYGAKLSFGMNYFVAKRLALGMEYGLGVQSLVTGGDKQDVTQIDPVSGASSTVRVLSSTRSTNTGLYVDPTAMITLSYFFSLK